MVHCPRFKEYFKEWVFAAAILLLFWSSPVRAAASAGSFSLDVGAYGTQLDKRLHTSGAYSSKVSTLAGFFRARKALMLNSWISWDPSLGLMLPWQSGADGFAKTFFVHTAVGFGVFPMKWFHLRLGPGLLWKLTITNAESVDLNNGTSTSTFYTPGGSKSVFLLTTDVGIDFRFASSWSLGFDVWILEIASSQRRTFNGAVTVGIYL